MTKYESTAWAPINVALIKHWGLQNERGLLPARPSLSMALEYGALTTVHWESHGNPEHILSVNGTRLDRKSNAKSTAAYEVLDRIRNHAGLDHRRALVQSTSVVPMSIGLGSSSAGAAALTLAALHAAGFGEMSELEKNLPGAISWVARTGCFSAARSLQPGISLLEVHAGELALEQVRTALDLTMFSCLVEDRHKEVSSSEGHMLAGTSPCWEIFRSAGEPRAAETVRALGRGDLKTAGLLIEQDALAMHGVMLTSRPPLIYATENTWSVWREVGRWRGEGLGAWCTLDAGANPHVLCATNDADEVGSRLETLAEVRRLFRSGVSTQGAHIISSTYTISH